MEENGKQIDTLLGSLPSIENIIANDIESYPVELDNWLQKCASDGEMLYPWHRVAPILAIKTVIILNSYFRKRGFLGPIIQTFEQRKSQILKLFSNRKHTPFTFQRLVELLLDPEKYYLSTHKLMNAIEKLMLIALPADKKKSKVRR